MRPSFCLLERAERRTASAPPHQCLMEAWNVASAREAHIKLPKEFVPNNIRFHSAESTTLRSIRSGSYSSLRPLLLVIRAEAMVARSTLPQGRDAREDFVFAYKFLCLESLPLAFSKLWSVTGRSLGTFLIIVERVTDEKTWAGFSTPPLGDLTRCWA